MRRGVAIALVLAATAARAEAPKKGAAKRVSFDVHHAADGGRYPTPVDEHYELSRDGTLYYEAHFEKIATGHNSNDVTTWKSAASAAAVFEAVDKVAGELTETEPEVPTDVYAVTLDAANKTETTRYAGGKSKAHAAIGAPFQAAVTSFEKATGRPLKPDQLEKH